MVIKYFRFIIWFLLCIMLLFSCKQYSGEITTFNPDKEEIYNLNHQFDRITSLCFLNQDTGLILGRNKNGWLVSKTIDGAKTFSNTYLSNTCELNQFSFSSKYESGFIYGNNGCLFFTNDTGETWKKIYFDFFSDNVLISDVEFIQRDTCFIVCSEHVNLEENFYILKSYNNGMNWYKTNIAFPLYDIEYDQNGKLFCPSENKLYISTDYCNSFQYHSQISNGVLKISTDSTAIVVDECNIFFSKDGLKTWQRSKKICKFNLFPVSTAKPIDVIAISSDLFVIALVSDIITVNKFEKYKKLNTDISKKHEQIADIQIINHNTIFVVTKFGLFYKITTNL